jgi:uncharacterized protein (DUF1800 family)
LREDAGDCGQGRTCGTLSTISRADRFIWRTSIRAAPMKSATIHFRARRLLAACALLLGTGAVAQMAATPHSLATPAPSASAPLTDAQKARFVLDRLGFGARPGEVAQVQAMGVAAWIERQLRPDSIDDAALAVRLRGLSVPDMSTAELFRKYPNPTAVLRGIERNDSSASGRNGRNAPAMAEDGNERGERRQALARAYREMGADRPQEVYLQLAADRLLRATYSERQLQEVMVDFWSNHFNVYARKNVSQWFLPAFDRDVIRKHALGNFRELLLASAQSPAMLFYLDNFESVSADANLAGTLGAGRRELARLPDAELREQLMRRRGLSASEADERIRRLRSNPDQSLGQRLPTGLNENYARELLELHTLGVDGGYTQQDIREVARCLTGWSIYDARGYRAYAATRGDDDLDRQMRRQGNRLGLPENGESGTFHFNARLHDTGAKTVLGQSIVAGGIGDGLQVIDLLAKHPATARHVAGKLALKFVSDSPSPALIARVAAAFSRSDGDIRATLRALFNDPEFFAPQHYRAKIKTPFELVVSSLRALQADSNGREVQALLMDLGEPLYGFQAPTGYPDTAADWVNSGALLKRMNFAIALAANRIPGTRIDLAQLGATDAGAGLLESGLSRWLGEAATAATREGLSARLRQPLPEASLADASGMDAMFGSDERAVGGLTRGQRVRLQEASGDPQRIQVAALILGSPDFQRQ